MERHDGQIYVYERMGGQTEGQINRRTERWTGGWTGWIDRWMDRQMDGWTDRRTARGTDTKEKQTHACASIPFNSSSCRSWCSRFNLMSLVLYFSGFVWLLPNVHEQHLRALREQTYKFFVRVYTRTLIFAGRFSRAAVVHFQGNNSVRNCCQLPTNRYWVTHPRVGRTLQRSDFKQQFPHLVQYESLISNCSCRL